MHPWIIASIALFASVQPAEKPASPIQGLRQFDSRINVYRPTHHLMAGLKQLRGVG